MKQETGLLSQQKAANILGVSKSDVSILVATGQLNSVPIGQKVYIPYKSIAALLNIEEVPDFVTSARRYPSSEELSSPLTTKPQVAEKGEPPMYKGSISKLKDGRFMVQVDMGKGKDGKRNRYSRGFKSEVEAKEHLRVKLNELNGVAALQAEQNTPAAASTVLYTTMTFENYAIKCLNEGIGGGTAGSRTVEGYRRGLSLVADRIGKMPIAGISAKKLQSTFDSLIYDYAESSIKRAYLAVNLVFKAALEQGDIPLNPMEKVKRPRSKKIVVQDRHPVYDDKDLELVFRLSRDHNFELYTMITLLACTGMRPEELRALEWDCFDEKSKTIYIHQAISKQFEEVTSLKKQPRGKSISTVTKNKYSVRTLKLSDLAVEALLEWKQLLAERKNQYKKNSTFIFPNREGTFKSEDGVSSLFDRFKQKYPETNYMKMTPYKFRHTMCTNLCKEKYPIKVIQRIMGDNTPDVIIKIYTHVENCAASYGCRAQWNCSVRVFPFSVPFATCHCFVNRCRAFAGHGW